jgi:21S rRNA (GM2251-2'-O)-methyltransferase
MDLKKRKDAGTILRIKQAATDAGIPIVMASKHALNDLADQRPHQGLVLDCEELGWERVVLPNAETLAAAGGPPPVWLIMDEVFDPVRFPR